MLNAFRRIAKLGKRDASEEAANGAGLQEPVVPPPSGLRFQLAPIVEAPPPTPEVVDAERDLESESDAPADETSIDEAAPVQEDSPATPADEGRTFKLPGAPDVEEEDEPEAVQVVVTTRALPPSDPTESGTEEAPDADAPEPAPETEPDEETKVKAPRGPMRRRTKVLLGAAALSAVVGVGAAVGFLAPLYGVVQIPAVAIGIQAEPTATAAEPVAVAVAVVPSVEEPARVPTVAVPAVEPDSTSTPVRGMDPNIAAVAAPADPTPAAATTQIADVVQRSSVSRVIPPPLASNVPMFEHALFGGKLIYILEGQPPSLDLTYDASYAARSVSGHIFEHLLGTDRHGQVRPDMAETWKLTDNIWSFQLRPGLVFHDDAEVDAHDVQASLERWLRRDTTLGVEMARKWAGYHALDARTFNIHMHESSFLLMDSLSRSVGALPAIYPREVIHATPDDQPISVIVGTGPYMLEDISGNGGQIDMVRYEPYIPRIDEPSHLSGAKIAYLERLSAVVMHDHEARLAAVVSGAADYAASIEPDLLPQALNHADVVTARVNRPGFQANIAFNTLSPTFDYSPSGGSLRRAVQIGLSARRVMVASGLDPRLWQLCDSLHLCGTPWEAAAADPDFLYNQGDRGRASSLMQRGGYTDETIVILNPTDVPHLSRMATNVNEQLNELGFRAFEERTTWAGALTTMNGTEDWHMMPTASRSTLYHPLTNLQFRVGRMAYPHDSDTGFLMDQLRDQLAGATTRAAQEETLRRMSRAAWADPRRLVMGQFFDMTVHRNELAMVETRDIPDGVANFFNVRWDDTDRRWDPARPAPEGIRVLTGN